MEESDGRDHIWELATQLSGGIWTEKDHAHKDIDVGLANSFAKVLVVWIEEAARQSRNAEFYRELLHKCGESLPEKLREELFICDDGSVSQDILSLKVPELVRELASEFTALSETYKNGADCDEGKGDLL